MSFYVCFCGLNTQNDQEIKRKTWALMGTPDTWRIAKCQLAGVKTKGVPKNPDATRGCFVGDNLVSLKIGFTKVETQDDPS